MNTSHKFFKFRHFGQQRELYKVRNCNVWLLELLQVSEDFVAVVRSVFIGAVGRRGDAVVVEYIRNDDVPFLYEANFDTVLIVTRRREKLAEGLISWREQNTKDIT